MLRFTLFGFPVMVHWLFWLIAFLLGGGLFMQSAREWPDVFVRMVVIFFSILVHELGHAAAARLFGLRPGIAFHGLGGLTYFSGGSLERWQHFLVVAAGPLSSLALAGCFVILLPLENISPLMPTLIWTGVILNVAWTIINCLPVLPMDGGQMLRDILGPKHERTACTIGAVVAALVIIPAVLFKFYILAVLMGFLAYSNFKGSTSMQGGVLKQ
ncbi:MAG: M50 family metallopeptidase [Verrucomicrobiota bacterium]